MKKVCTQPLNIIADPARIFGKNPQTEKLDDLDTEDEFEKERIVKSRSGLD